MVIVIAPFRSPWLLRKAYLLPWAGGNSRSCRHGGIRVGAWAVFVLHRCLLNLEFLRGRQEPSHASRFPRLGHLPLVRARGRALLAGIPGRRPVCLVSRRGLIGNPQTWGCLGVEAVYREENVLLFHVAAPFHVGHVARVSRHPGARRIHHHAKAWSRTIRVEWLQTDPRQPTGKQRCVLPPPGFQLVDYSVPDSI